MKAKKSFGQHFLVEEDIAARLASAIRTDGCATVVEIGPGKGILTRFLIQQPLPVVAVELDRDLIPFLKKAFKDTTLEIVQGDILHVRLEELVAPNEDFVIVGNFPYNISSQIIFLGLQHRHRVPFMAGMFQYEVANRICAGPGSKTYGVISVLVQAYYRAELLFKVGPESFAPPPKVQSAVISLTRYQKEIEDVPYNVLRQIVKVAFHQRRKKLRNTLTSIMPETLLEEMGVEALRPEQLSVDQFVMIAKRFQEVNS